MIVTVVHLNQECATTTIIFDYDDDAEQFSSLAIGIDIGDDFLGELATLELILVPVVAGSTSTISHSFVIDIPIEIVEQEPEDEETDDTGNNTGDGTDKPDDNLNEGNETEPPSDSDGDGIFDTLDNCPNTLAGAVVDEVGCEVIEQEVDDSNDLVDEQPSNETENQQNTEASANQEGSDDTLMYLVIGIIVAALVAGLVFVRIRSSGAKAIPAAKTIQPITPLPPIPLAPVEPVVLQQWTDANGYSWRQMSDQTILWWNGSDWIPYGKN